MVIDAGQIWKHKHNNKPVEVLGASDGLVVFLRGDRKQEWPVARFMVWHRYAYESQKPEPEPRRPKRDELWYSQAKGESCLIKDANSVCVSYQYATSDQVDYSDIEHFLKKHEFYRESPSDWKLGEIPPPHYDPKSVAFPAAPSAEEMIRRTSQAAKHARRVSSDSRSATGAVVAPSAEAIEDLRIKAVEALAECHLAAQELRCAIDRLNFA